MRSSDFVHLLITDPTRQIDAPFGEWLLLVKELKSIFKWNFENNFIFKIQVETPRAGSYWEEGD